MPVFAAPVSLPALTLAGFISHAGLRRLPCVTAVKALVRPLRSPTIAARPPPAVAAIGVMPLKIPAGRITVAGFLSIRTLSIGDGGVLGDGVAQQLLDRRDRVHVDLAGPVRDNRELLGGED